MKKNPAAVALGKMAKGIPKTMTPAALKARKLNAKKPRPRNPQPARQFEKVKKK